MANATLARFGARAMGSALRLTVSVDDGKEGMRDATAAWAEVVDEFERSEQAMSRFRDTSELTRAQPRGRERAAPWMSGGGSSGQSSPPIGPTG